MRSIPNYQTLQLIYESNQSVVYRGKRQSDQLPVILKILKKEYPTPEELARYRQEYDLIKSLDSPAIIKAYQIEKYQNTLAIILEDFGGESLKTLNKMSIISFLPLAIQITDNLRQIHHAQIIHKDINPANIVWNPTTHQVKIIDFGIASRLPRESPTLKSPEQLEGTLAYISPEQSGRVNRTLDYRTDLYSLGVTFYQLLSGKLPFENNQAIELVHCHIAKSPIPLVKIDPEIPSVISEIIMKLMEKNAEDRYQSASGLKWDLEQCLLQLEANGKIEPFVLAQKDFSGKLQIPQKLYGRETEIETLLNAFERIRRGTGEIMLVTGYSGIGKTALVQDFRQLIAGKQGRFIIGKFSELQRNIPYSALTQAFNSFCDQLLVESEEHLVHCRKRILANIGNNGQLLIDVIPHLKWVIGQQPTVTSVNHQSAQNRFNLVFQQFFQTICNKEHPLVLVLDDMQWADSASLNLLKKLMIDTPHLYSLMIGIYREQEVDATHPVALMFKELQDHGITVNTSSLQDLQLADVQVIIAESLQCKLDEAQELAQVIYRKTQGNAFFIHEFLKSLYTQELLVFNATHWQWDIDKIKATATSHNVIDLMVDKIHLLPEYTQLSLELASCIGNQFDLKTLSVLCQQPSAEILFYLWPALEQELLLPLDDCYKQSQKIESHQCNSRFKFQYDRIRQAAYSLIAEVNKPAFHLQIAQYLLSLYANDIETHIFNIADQFNLAIVLVETETMKKEVIRLNLIAGKKAQATFAYQSALNYLNTGLTLLTEQSWMTDYELTLQFYTTIAEVKFLNAQFEMAEKYAQIVLQQVEILLDKVKVYEIMISLYMARNQMQLALETTIQVLDQLGVYLEKDPPRELKIENGYHLPRATQPDKLAAMRVLNFAISPAYTVAPHLFPSIVFTMVKLSAEHGNSPLSIFGYSTYGLLLCAMYGEVENGYQAGQLAMNLVRQFNEKALKARGFAAYYVGVHHWKRPARETIEPLLEAARSSLESGDFEFTGVTAMHCSSYLFWVGELLKTVAATQVQLLTMVQSVKQDYQQIYLSIWRQTVCNLQELNSTPCRLVGKWFNEDEVLPNVLKTNYGMAIFGIYLAKSMLYYLFKDYAQSVHHAALAEDYEQANVGVMVVPICKFYHSLALLATYPTSTIPEKLAIIQKVDSNQTQMKQWAFHAPQNYQHRYELVEAEKAKVLGQLEAIEWYEQAIQHAKDHLYLQEEALAFELAAEFYLERKMEKFAQLYLKEAHHRYQQWGAITKVNDLENRYSHWLSSTVVVSPAISDSVTMKRESTTTSLDLGSIIKASQTLSGEVLLEKLLEKLMHTIIENAGAERGVFILEKQGKWLIEAEGVLNQELVNVLQSLPLPNRVSTTIVNYVIRTEKPVVLDRATQEGLYREEDYIRRHHLKSVLCMPIISQKKLGAIVYLENNLTEGAFTPDRIEVLTLLSSQIAISLKNALFIKDLEIARQQAEIANQAKTAFLANMSHEFKTPLNSILGHVQLLNREGNLPITTIRNSCHVIQQNSEYLLTLINDIIDIATIETGNMELHPLNVRFDHFLNNLIHIFKNRAQEKNLEFHYQMSPKLPIGICTDEKRLRQILTHLLSNAVKFTQQGKVTFTVYPYQDKTRFKVEDSGVGVASADLEKIFLPFEQVSHWKQKSAGTGLGLPLAKKLTEMMQGTLGVESEVEQGSCFWVDLPLTKSTEWMGEHFEEITSENSTPLLESTEEELINAINLLSIEKTKSLLNLSRNGDVIALLKQADQLEQMGHQFNALVTKIRQTAQVYDTDTIGDLLETHLNEVS